MNALVEDAVFHESEGILKWVSSVEGEGFMASLQKSNWRDLGVCGHVVVTALILGLIIMPKIKTTRTKKSPEGFEEIEPVDILYCLPCNPR